MTKMIGGVSDGSAPAESSEVEATHDFGPTLKGTICFIWLLKMQACQKLLSFAIFFIF